MTHLRSDNGPSSTGNTAHKLVIDGLQYANWSEKIFREMAAGKVSAVHVTITYHETFRETVANLEDWSRRFERFAEFIIPGRSVVDIDRAVAEGKTAIFFGAQNPSCMEDDIGLIEILHCLGLRFMQLSYNNQSLLATGCYERSDPGLTRMGREVVTKMNRVGLVVDMSHAGERSTLDAIEASSRPVVITHANPSSWHPARRNVSETVLQELGASGGMLGVSLYPHHLKAGSDCTLESFCDMIVRATELIGPEQIGLGSDLCQDQPDSVVHWMRNGRWCESFDYGEGNADVPGFPAMPSWFQDNRDFEHIRDGLAKTGLDQTTINGIMGENWYRFFKSSFTQADDV